MGDEADRIVRFPLSRVRPGGGEPAKDLGLTPLTRRHGSAERSARGHWCSRCRGIWYSQFLESQCPAFGNRHG